jgi:hypothetical protein
MLLPRSARHNFLGCFQQSVDAGAEKMNVVDPRGGRERERERA